MDMVDIEDMVPVALVCVRPRVRVCVRAPVCVRGITFMSTMSTMSTTTRKNTEKTRQIRVVDMRLISKPHVHHAPYHVHHDVSVNIKITIHYKHYHAGNPLKSTSNSLPRSTGTDVGSCRSWLLTNQ